MSLRTTGAKDSMCEVWAAKIRYKYHPPQTRNLKNGPEDLVIKCYAPGNRYREVVIEPRIAGKTYANILNGLAPGVFVDYTSGSMFAFPDTIDIDFTNIPYTAMPPPAHNNTDIMDPDKYYLEEFRPYEPRMNDDRFRKDYPLERRVSPGSEDDAYSSSLDSGNANVTSAGEKGELGRVLESLGATEQSDEQGAGQNTAVQPQIQVPPLFPDEPLPLFPIE